MITSGTSRISRFSTFDYRFIILFTPHENYWLLFSVLGMWPFPQATSGAGAKQNANSERRRLLPRHNVVQRAWLRANRQVLQPDQLDCYGPRQPWLRPQLRRLGRLLEVAPISAPMMDKLQEGQLWLARHQPGWGWGCRGQYWILWLEGDSVEL